MLVVRSHIKPSLKSHILFQGSLLAITGVGILLIAYFLPESFLSHWGWLVWIIAFGLIAIRLIPYRRLTKLESHPFEIVIDQGMFSLRSEKGIVLQIPINEIDKIKYLESSSMYGIGIWLNTNSHLKNNYLKFSHKSFDCDVFLPFFSEKAAEKITAELY
jgi:hypothetical protein